MKIAVAVSGGMDSLYALHSLHKEGHGLIALHGRFLPLSGELPDSPDPAAGLREFCDSLGVPFHCLDLREEFERRVIAPFCRAYLAGQTPNPCAACNAAIKFGALWEAAISLGADRLATGHYVRLLPCPEAGNQLLPAVGEDISKDQSYFLALTPIERLRASIFPLGGKRKSDIRRELEAAGITPPLPGESQEICFVPDNDYRAFLIARDISLPGPGPVLDASGKRLGTHQGLWRHTEGQRKGLGIAAEQPLYVLRKDTAANALIVGPADQAACPGCRAASANYLLDPALWPADVLARVRYRQPAQPARVECGPKAKYGSNSFGVRFARPQPAPACGQVAAVYDARGFLLAGGVITSVDAE